MCVYVLLPDAVQRVVLRGSAGAGRGRPVPRRKV